MKRCDKEDQSECDLYEAKCDGKPGYVDLTCLFWRKDYLDDNGTGNICTAPPPQKVKD